MKYIVEYNKYIGSKFKIGDNAISIVSRKNLKKDRIYKVVKIKYLSILHEYQIKILDVKEQQYVSRQNTNVRPYQCYSDFLEDDIERAAWFKESLFLSDIEIEANKYNL